jgi:hypothetical protein
MEPKPPREVPVLVVVEPPEETRLVPEGEAAKPLDVPGILERAPPPPPQKPKRGRYQNDGPRLVATG